MEMVKVQRCEVSECAYNSDHKCHTMAITVGHDDAHPMCDTFCRSASKGGQPGMIAGVGACKVASCIHNNALECEASSVKVGRQHDEVDCLTFKRR
jgi:hypothetical protein